VEAAIGGELHRQAFGVQDYVKPDYTVKVTAEASNYVVGDTIHLSLDAQYLYGQPVRQAAVVVKLYQLSAPECYSASCGDQKDTWYQSDEPTLTAVTDANGRYAATLTANLGNFTSRPYWWSDLAQARWGLE